MRTEQLDADATERVAQMLDVMEVGFKSRPEALLSVDERIARDAMRRVIELVREALRGW
jgi:hypothetical protein